MQGAELHTSYAFSCIYVTHDAWLGPPQGANFFPGITRATIGGKECKNPSTEGTFDTVSRLCSYVATLCSVSLSMALQSLGDCVLNALSLPSPSLQLVCIAPQQKPGSTQEIQVYVNDVASQTYSVVYGESANTLGIMQLPCA